MTDDNAPQPPQPDPELRKLDRLVGTWSMNGHMAGSDEESIVGETKFEWLPGGFFLRQTVRIDFAGMFTAEGEELIWFDPETRGFKSHVYSSSSPVPLPYAYAMEGDRMTISVSYGPLDASFEGRFSEDGNSFSGSWRPNPGADETINVAYDIGGSRVG
jgi:hypothetical protein